MSAQPEAVVLADAPALAASAARRFSALADEAIATRGRFAVALAGGSTPAGLYRLLAGPPYAGEIDWSRMLVFFGDERCVPPEHPDSNYRMARETLLDHVPVASVHRIRGEDPPDVAAGACERELRAAFATPSGPPRPGRGACFDLVLLGMGDNGHTASLFPRSPALHERERWAVAARVDAQPPLRITITVPVINAAAEVVILVAGADKAPMLRRVLRAPADPEELPVQLVAPSAGRLRWLVDAAAAAELRGS
jgi:6-phosphogluconolactonase